ncbi:MAG: DNA replication/repair protein RecF [Anaerovoracaceae bacterium]
MYIENIELKNFRNYEELSLDFDKKLNLIVGNNAQGKTNLIEGIYISSLGKSFRTSRDRDMIRFGCDAASVRVRAHRDIIDTKIEIKINKKGKFVRKDGSKVRKMSDLVNNIVIVVFSPEDLKIVKEEPEVRRKFIDRELSQLKPAYFESLGNYRRALAQRNICLKEDQPDRSVISLFDEQLIKFGSDIMKMRKEFIDEINILSAGIHAEVTNGAEKLRIEYSPNMKFSAEREEQEKIIREDLGSSFDNDIRMRTTTRGPHKDDISFYINDVNVRKFGSQGQQRTCALSLKLAELRLIKNESGENAVLILDDVMSELDNIRREYLVRTFEENQIFITSTDIDEGIIQAYPDAKIIRVKNGNIF